MRALAALLLGITLAQQPAEPKPGAYVKKSSRVETAKATVLPSGESWGSEILWIFSRASASKGLFCA